MPGRNDGDQRRHALAHAAAHPRKLGPRLRTRRLLRAGSRAPLCKNRRSPIRANDCGGWTRQPGIGGDRGRERAAGLALRARAAHQRRLREHQPLSDGLSVWRKTEHVAHLRTPGPREGSANRRRRAGAAHPSRRATSHRGRCPNPAGRRDAADRVPPGPRLRRRRRAPEPCPAAPKWILETSG